MRKFTPSYHQKKMFPVKQPPQDRKPHFQRGDKVKKEEPSEVVCYECGTPDVIKPKCPSYSSWRSYIAFKSCCHSWDENNNALLGMDFLESSGIVLNVKRKTWFFNDQPKREFHFVEQIQETCDAVKLNVSKTATPLTVKETDHLDLSHADEVNHLTSIQQLELKDHSDQLREDEGTHLTAIQKKKLNELLFRYRNSFCLGGEATPFSNITLIRRTICLYLCLLIECTSHEKKQ
ncbi:hypothetical protein NPIL_681331 [Nephila pilipes]|uniref:Uncharacterized protein n=1 Tax=Nephila pilipes TaxID=299642 RepID=A0A8X6MVU4_NEPPI|nr:hypothetical protein NPIL_681331 [Nephila pilipes]